MSKRLQQFVKFVRRFLIRNAPHFYGLPPDLCWKRQELRRFTRRCTVARPSKCGAHGGRKVAHMAAVFSRAAATRLLHSFRRIPYNIYYIVHPPYCIIVLYSIQYIDVLHTNVRRLISKAYLGDL